MTKRVPHPALIVVGVLGLALACSYGIWPERGAFAAVGGAAPATLVGWLAAAVTYRARPWTSGVIAALAVLAVFALDLIGHG